MSTPILSWSDVSLGMTVLLIIILIIMHHIIFYTLVGWDPETQSKIHNITEFCFSRCKTDLCKNITDNARGRDYYLGSSANRNCAFGLWELSHFMMHVFIGYFYNIYYSQGISIGFEIYEWKIKNCGSWLDLGYNFAGFLTGHTLKNYTSSNNENEEKSKYSINVIPD